PNANNDYAIAYAYATVTIPERLKCTLGIGSDDGCRVFLNGKLIFETQTPRPLVDDQDLVDIDLAPGVNRILLKIQNITSGWGFSCRLLDETGISLLLGPAAVAGDLHRVNMLLDRRVDPNTASDIVASPLQLARLFGNGNVEDRLIAAGAD